MTADKVNSELEKSAGEYTHVTFHHQDDVYVVLMDKNGAIEGAYDKNHKFNLKRRAMFSLLSLKEDVSNALGDEKALKTLLTGDDYVASKTEWVENYVVEVMQKIYALPNGRSVHVEKSNEALYGDEKDVLIQPVDLQDMADTVQAENEAYDKAMKDIGLTKAQMNSSTIRKIKDYDIDTDEKFFLSLEEDPKAMKKGVRLGKLDSWSGGFQLSSILDTIVELVLDGYIEIDEVVKNDYGDRVTIAADKNRQDNAPEPIISVGDEDDLSNLNTDFVDLKSNGSEDDDNREADEIIEESQPATITIDNEKDEDKDDSSLESDDSDLGELTPINEIDDDQVHEDDSEDSEENKVNDSDEEDNLEPITGVDDESFDNLDEDAGEANNDSDDEKEEDTEEEPDEIQALITKAEQVAKEKAELHDKMVERLAELKKRKSEVDDAIDDLPTKEVEELDKAIDSLKIDRDEINKKIEEARNQRSEVDKEIADKRAEKAEYEERLSKKDELEQNQNDLSAQIEALSGMLKS